MKTMLDVRNLLKRFGIFIYTSDRRGDVDLMELEVKELYKAQMITKEEYTYALLILKKEQAKYI